VGSFAVSLCQKFKPFLRFFLQPWTVSAYARIECIGFFEITGNADFSRSAASFFVPGTIRKFTLTAFWQTLWITLDSCGPGKPITPNRTTPNAARDTNRPTPDKRTPNRSQTTAAEQAEKA
jgi:hypothetical protein